MSGNGPKLFESDLHFHAYLQKVAVGNGLEPLQNVKLPFLRILTFGHDSDMLRPTDFCN